MRTFFFFFSIYFFTDQNDSLNLYSVKMEGMPSMLGIKADASSPLDKHRPNGAPAVESWDLSQAYIVKDQKDKLNVNRNFIGAERKSSLSRAPWKFIDQGLGSLKNHHLQPSSLFMEGSKVELNGPPYENSLFSSSLSDLFKKNCKFSSFSC